MSIKKDFIYNLSYQILIIIMPFITTPYISRVIGPEGVGIQAYTLSIVNYFVLFAMLGINSYGNRSIAMSRDDREKLSKVFCSIYSIQLFMSLIMTVLYILFIAVFINKYKIIFIIQLIYIISALLDINWFFFGMEKFKLTVVRNFIIKIISVVSIFIFVKNTSDIYIYSLILAISTLVSQLILWRYLKEYISFSKVTMNDIKKHIKPILVLFIPVLAVSIYKIMDKIMLGSISDVMQVGIYENSEKIISIPMGVITALATVMLPKMSNLQVNGYQEDSKRYIFASIEFVMFIGFGAMFGLIGINDVIIPIFLGESFIECIDTISILSISILFLAWANVIRTQYLIPKKKDKIYIISTILGAVVNLLINLLLIGKLGAKGAAIGTLFAEVTVCIYQTMMIRYELDIKNYLKRSIFYIVPGIIMFIIIKYIGKLMGISILTAIIEIILGGSIYCIISLVYMFVIQSYLIKNIRNRFIRELRKKIV